MARPQQVTFLFTDIEGSTRLWERYPQAMYAALARHDEILRQAIEEHGGQIFKTMGDAFYAAFDTALDALTAAIEAQHALCNEPWAEIEPLRVRMALHTGPVEYRDQDYFGLTLSRVDRLLRAGHGGQILLSLPTQEHVLGQLPQGAQLRDLGERRLKDLVCLEHIFQFIAPGLPNDFPPLRTLDAHRTNLPAQTTFFIGREQEMAEVKTLLRRKGVRLVTLTGPGGTGKTRLGLQVAADLLDDFADGVYFVALAAIRDPELVIPTIARTLAVQESAGQTLLESIKGYLRGKEMLLLLDNLEQVVEAAPALADLLSAAPRLKLLSTSRAALRVYGEYEYFVLPLPLPELDHLPPAAALKQSPAVALFIERTRAVRPNFDLDEDNAPAVAEICARLDGLPLAIELAAARSKLFSPQAMLSRFRGPPQRSSLEVLTGGPRDLPARQQTLRGAMDWSYELLSEAEKRLFARLGVFVGGWSITAAETVCNAGGELELDTVSGLLALVDQSVIRQGEGVDREPRFTMLETIREYALERLVETGESDATQHRHAAHYLSLAEKAEPLLSGPRQMHWLTRLEEEHDNLRAALDWALQRDSLELALRLSAAMGLFWHTRGYLSEGRRWLETALERSHSLPAPALRANTLNAAGFLAHDQGDYAAGRAYAREALGILQELGDKRGLATTYHRLGGMAMYEGNQAQAAEYFAQSLDLWRELGIQSKIPSTLNNMGLVAMYQGDLEKAMALHQESLAGFREQGNHYGEVSSLLLLGLEALQLEKSDLAERYCQEALSLLDRQGDVRRVIEGLEIYAGVLVAQGRFHKAAVLCGAAEDLREQFETPLPPVDRPFVEQIHRSVQEALGAAGLAAAYAEGRALTAEQAIAHALKRDTVET